MRMRLMHKNISFTCISHALYVLFLCFFFIIIIIITDFFLSFVIFWKSFKFFWFGFFSNEESLKKNFLITLNFLLGIFQKNKERERMIGTKLMAGKKISWREQKIKNGGKNQRVRTTARNALANNRNSLLV